MSIYYEDAGLQLFHGSNKDIMPTFEAESFDSIVTDPPYELGFMGKGWDSSGIAYDVEMWRECWRVLKPGGYLLAFGGTRTWHRIATAIEDAGFEIRDSMAWLYGSGFPKSMNVAKAITGHEGGFGSNSGAIRRATMGDSYEPSGRLGNRDGAGRRDTGLSDHELELSKNAREWEGWGTALKPAFEPIIVARKPLVGTVAANVLAYGTGAINIDASRVPASDSQLAEKYASVQNAGARSNSVYGDDARDRAGAEPHAAGRFPANVLLDGSQAAVLDVQSGIQRDGVAVNRNRGEERPMTVEGAPRLVGSKDDVGFGGSGGASRFFPTFRYEAKAPGSERPEVDGVAHATVKPLDLMRWLVRLVTRRGGRVLDPFAGSGTTGEAALLEGMEAVLIELEESHLPLILQRVRKPLQPSMFGDWEETA